MRWMHQVEVWLAELVLSQVVVGQNQIFPCWSAVLSGVVSVRPTQRFLPGSFFSITIAHKMTD